MLKPHLVNWDGCAKNRRGLGVRSLDKLNKALLAKWSWRNAEERGALGKSD